MSEVRIGIFGLGNMGSNHARSILEGRIGRLTYTRNEMPVAESRRSSPEFFSRPPTHEVVVPAADHGGQHHEILQNFTAAILDRAPLIAPAAGGRFSVELANALLLPAWTNKTIELPLNRRLYENWLMKKITASRSSGRPEARRKSVISGIE